MMDDGIRPADERSLTSEETAFIESHKLSIEQAMRETFGTDCGLYWGVQGQPASVIRVTTEHGGSALFHLQEHGCFRVQEGQSE